MLSIILLSYFSNNKLVKVHSNLVAFLNANGIEFELIIIDDGSHDNSFLVAQQLEDKFSNVRSFQLSKNYTSHYAIFAGLSVSKGNCATVIPDDEQQPYDTIVEMYKLWQNGTKIVIPHRISRDDGFFSNKLSDFFYKIMNRFSEIEFPIGGADSFLIDREIIDILSEKIHPINTTSITEILRLGYSPVFLPYYRPKGNNHKSRWTFKKKLRLAKDFFFSSSTFPIKLITNMGVFFSLVSLIIILLYAYARLFGNENYWKLSEVPGWTSTIIIISFFSGLILFSLGIISEYIWRIYEEVKNRPGYIIKKKNEDIKK
jgi:glycosyltransferase involved in cell wall biosynthesis